MCDNKEDYNASRKDYCKAYYDEHRENELVRAREYFQKHKEDRREKNAANARAKYQNSPVYRVANLYRSRLKSAMRQLGKSQLSRSEIICGCTWDALKSHLEGQFQEGMTWDNQSEWHIDHIKPCSSFDLTDPKQVSECFHYSNLQPLWATENRSKGAKY